MQLLVKLNSQCENLRILRVLELLDNPELISRKIEVTKINVLMEITVWKSKKFSVT